LFFGAFMAIGVFLATLAAAILAGGVHARWVGWASLASSVLVFVGSLLVLGADSAFLAVLAGLMVFMVVLVALGVTLWRQVGSDTTRGDLGRDAVAEPG
jgi:hypothetical protein